MCRAIFNLDNEYCLENYLHNKNWTQISENLINYTISNIVSLAIITVCLIVTLVTSTVTISTTAPSLSLATRRHYMYIQNVNT